MFEKFFRKPKAEENESRQESHEQIAGLGQRTLIKEAGLEIEPRRSGGYMLCTVLAMALAMGLSTGKAEAQTRWIVEERGFGRQLAGQIFSRGVFEASSAIDRAHGKKIAQIENDYVMKLTALEDAKRKLDNDYLRERSRLARSGGTDKERRLQELNAWYQTEAVKLEQNQIEVRRSYEKSKRGEQVKHGVVDSIFRGVRGW
jgi:hypothetical protein